MATIGELLGHREGKTALYFDYSRSKIVINAEYMDEFGEVMKI